MTTPPVQTIVADTLISCDQELNYLLQSQLQQSQKFNHSVMKNHMQFYAFMIEQQKKLQKPKRC